MKTSDKKPYWFVRKPYWWWRIPASREGRIVLCAYMVLVIVRTIYYASISQADQAMRAWTDMVYYAWWNALVALVPIVLLTVVLLAICYKTGEEPKRQRWKKK